MPAYPRKKIEIVVERPLARRVLDWLSAQGVKGHSLIPNVSGSGHHGSRGPGDVSGVFENVLIIAVAPADKAYAILEASTTQMKDTAAVVFLSDVEVARPEHF